MSPHAATFPEALAWLDLMLGYGHNQTWMPLTIWRPGDQFARTEHHQVNTPAAPGRLSSRELLQRWIRHLDLHENAQVHLGAPRQLPNGGAGTATCLWAVIAGSDQNKRLGWLKVPPDLILREGSSSRRTCLWALDHPMRWTGILRANRRIAYRLGAVQKHSEPERLELPAPGTCLRRDRTRPVPIVVERCTWTTHPWHDIIGRLRDAPAPDAWRTAAAR